MHFDELLNLTNNANDSKTQLQFPANWCQGRTAFGGLSAAMLYQAIRRQIDPSRRLLSLSTNFVGPLLAEQPFNIEVTILREGKNSSQVLAKAIQDDQVCVITQACFGIDRPSTATVPVSKKMQLKPVDESTTLPHQEGLTPAFFQHVSLCLESGALPFSGASTSHLGGWMRLKQTPKQLTEAHIIALTDAWPPAMLQLYKQPAPASSMSWYLEFIQEPKLAADEWLGFEAVTHHSKGGYGLEDGCIWSSTGELLALTRQTVALFA